MRCRAGKEATDHGLWFGTECGRGRSGDAQGPWRLLHAARASALRGSIDVYKRQGQKVQVSGNVVQDSFSTSNDVLTFKIYDPEGDPATQLEVR